MNSFIKIIKPKCIPGHFVWVHNYRKKPKEGTKVFEYGECMGASYSVDRNGVGQWHYDIRLVRRGFKRWDGDEGNPIDLSAYDEAIKL